MSTIRELFDLARADVEGGWLPSCQLAVARDGELVAFETFGAATDATRYCIFSCAKPIVVSAVDVALRRARFAEWGLEWEPGTRFEYHATSAHWVLADLIDRLGGMDFRDFVEQRVCKPLGLPRLLGIPAGDQAGIAPLVGIGELWEPPVLNDEAMRGLKLSDLAAALEE